MPSNNSINLANLDIGSLEQDFIAYLQTQSQFKDYNFNSSNIRILLRILAMNTYKMGFMTNMQMNEAGLDTAQLYSSVISRAKDLNYLPRSSRSSKARISVSFNATGDNQPYVIPKGSSFSTIVKNTSYTFSVPENITVASANNTFTFETDIYEGRYLQDSYVFDASVSNLTLEITNPNVDTTSLVVTVKEDGDVEGTPYTFATTLLGLTETSKVFFLQMNQHNKYEVVFGDGVVGYKPKNNSIVTLSYRISSYDKPDGAKNFSINFDPTSPSGEMTSHPAITVITPALGGSMSEDIESVRFYAPRHFQVQERAVTADDYSIILREQFPEIHTVSVFGGEELNPPQFGKVFIAVDIANVNGFPESKKTEYFDFIKTKMPLSIRPVFIEPTYLYYRVISKVKYNLNVTSSTVEHVRSDVINAIRTFNENYLDDFAVTLYYSKLVAAIDNADFYIVSNSTEVEVYKKVNVVLGNPQNLTIDFGVPLINNFGQPDTHKIDESRTVYSAPFKQRGETFILEDDSDGNIRVMKVLGDKMSKVYNIGSVDYQKGVVTLSNFELESFDGPVFKLYAHAATDDITVGKNIIFTNEADEIDITIEPVRV